MNAMMIDPAEVLFEKRILMVDDRQSSLEFLKYALKRATHDKVSITEKDTLAGAVEELSEDPSGYDMVVIDLHIPGEFPQSLARLSQQIDVDLNEGQVLGLWLQKNRPGMPYCYLSAVPNAKVQSSVERDAVELLKKVDSAKGFPRRLAEFFYRAEHHAEAS